MAFHIHVHVHGKPSEMVLARGHHTCRPFGCLYCCTLGRMEAQLGDKGLSMPLVYSPRGRAAPWMDWSVVGLRLWSICLRYSNLEKKEGNWVFSTEFFEPQHLCVHAVCTLHMHSSEVQLFSLRSVHINKCSQVCSWPLRLLKYCNLLFSPLLCCTCTCVSYSMLVWMLKCEKSRTALWWNIMLKSLLFGEKERTVSTL